MSASRRTRPSAFETTLCAITRTSSGPSSTRSRSSAARSSPGRTSGMPGSGSSLTRRARAARAAPASAARPACPAASAARRAARSPGVSTSSSSDGSRPTRTVAPAAWASAACRAKEPGPKAGVSTVGGSSRSALVPEPWRSGTMTTPGAAETSRSSTSTGSKAGQSPGTSRTRCAPRATAVRTPRSAAADWPASTGSCTHSMPAVRPAALRRTHHDHTIQPPHRAQRLEHVPDHRGGQLGAIHPGGPQALLRAPERLDGEDGDRTHGARDYPRSAAANTSVSSATRRRASASPISTSVSSVGTPPARSSLTSPSIRPS